ncbi:MAG: DUF2262 domain-containing protein [Verrucomicrobiota bacterium]
METNDQSGEACPPAFESGEPALLRELAAAPEDEIFGVVSPSGIGIVRSGGEELWTLLINLSGWKSKASPFCDQEITIRQKTDKDTAHSIRDRFKAYDVIHVRARLAIENCFGSPQGLLTGIIVHHRADIELNEFAIDLQKPVTYNDPQFETFTLDRRVNWYESRAKWGSGNVRLCINVDNPKDDLEPLLKTARILWERQQHWENVIKDFAVKVLLEIKNDNWLEEGELPVTPTAFKQRMTLNSVSIEEGDHFEFWYDDGDLFWGHSISMSGSLTEGIDAALIQG